MALKQGKLSALQAAILYAIEALEQRSRRPYAPTIHEYVGDHVGINTIYTTLANLEGHGLVRSEYAAGCGGLGKGKGSNTPRRVYTVTAAGDRALEDFDKWMIDCRRRHDTARAVTDLIDGLVGMIAGGRLTEADVPDDFEWLCVTLEKLQPVKLYNAGLQHQAESNEGEIDENKLEDERRAIPEDACRAATRGGPGTAAILADSVPESAPGPATEWWHDPHNPDDGVESGKANALGPGEAEEVMSARKGLSTKD